MKPFYRGAGGAMAVACLVLAGCGTSGHPVPSTSSARAVVSAAASSPAGIHAKAIVAACERTTPPTSVVNFKAIVKCAVPRGHGKAAIKCVVLGLFHIHHVLTAGKPAAIALIENCAVANR
jgi:hypothetical protein